jgi:sulfate permease
MTVKNLLLLAVIVLFAANMGGSNFAVSFAAATGAKMVSRKIGGFLFVIFVGLGAFLVGEMVTKTLSQEIVPKALITFGTCLDILIAATVSLFVANLLHVPQSTSLVTVGSILGVGLYAGKVFWREFIFLVPFWVVIPIVGYIATYFLGRVIYPPRRHNFWIYEKVFNHHQRLRVFVIIASCYNAFAVGTNNVANAVGPLVGADIVPARLGLVLVAPLFGLGAVLFRGPLKMAGEDIVPLGVITGTILCIISGSLMIVASLLGIPQSFVMLKMASVFAIGSVKNGHKHTLSSPLTKKTAFTWAVTPVMATVVAYVLTMIRSRM